MKSSLFLAFLIFLGAGLAAYPAELIDRIIAAVDGEIVTQSELLLEVRLLNLNPESPDITREVLNSLISKKIYLQEAKKQGITPNSRSVENIIAEKSKGMSSQEFERVLQERRISLEDYESWLAKEIMIYELRGQKLKEIEREIRVDQEEIRNFYLKLEQYLEGTEGEREIREFYELYEEELRHAGKVRMAQILVRSEEEADRILSRIKDGEDFSYLAKEISLGPAAEKGGQLGWVDPATLKSPLKELIGKLESPVTIKVKGEGFFRIIQLQDKKEVSFHEYRDKIEEYLKNRRSEEILREWFEDLESKAEIEIIANLAGEIH
ncbi:MAG: peptidylprolyl isomerase [Candidatus Aerophobetes bacterium]